MKNVLTGNLIVFDDSDDKTHPKDILIADCAVEFFDNYYSITMKFPDGSWKKFWISQKTRLPKLEMRKAR